MASKQVARQKLKKMNGDSENGFMANQRTPEEKEMDDAVDESDYDNEDDDDDDDDDKNDFLTQRMPDQHPAVRTTLQLMELMDGDRPYLDLNPHYQRNVVWTRKAKQMLIDSMFHGFFIPPVIFNVEKVVDENGASRYKRTCVDGKQRLTSVRDFLRGRFPWRVGRKDWYYTTPTKEDGSRLPQADYKSILPEAQKEMFAKKALLCVEYKDLTQQQEIELFQRVQLGKPLTKAEIFRASQGKWQDLARTFEQDYSEVINLSRQNNRASGFWMVLQCFAQIFECQDPGGPNGIPRLRNRIPAIESLCSDNDSLDGRTKRHLQKVFDRFLELAQEYPHVFESKKYRRAKAFAPIELIAVCCMISEWSDNRPNGMLQGDILLMRQMLRDSTEELRGNWACWKMAWDYIDDLESFRGTTDGSTAEKRPSKNAKRRTRGHGVGNAVKAAAARTTGPKPGAPMVPNMLSRSETPAEPDEEYRPPSNVRTGTRPGPKGRPAKPTPTSEGIPITDLPFGGRKPFGGDYDSSSSSDDGAATDGGSIKTNSASIAAANAVRKRTIVDLGASSKATHDLEAKRARLNATRIKQEP